MPCQIDFFFSLLSSFDTIKMEIDEPDTQGAIDNGVAEILATIRVIGSNGSKLGDITVDLVSGDLEGESIASKIKAVITRLNSFERIVLSAAKDSTYFRINGKRHSIEELNKALEATK